MKYIASSRWEEGVAALTARLVSELTAKRRVLWLLSGGSNIATSVSIMNNLPAGLTSGLSVSLVDERYGPAGHTDSNWAQLEKAGLATKKAQLLPILKAGQTFKETLHSYQKLVAEAFAGADMIIALLGIGLDGHIAGILPHSSAANNDKDLVAGCDSSPHRRLTLTFPALRRLSSAYVFAFGEQKQTAITTLCQEKLPLVEQPAQILKELPEAYLYSDQIGDNQ